MANDGIKIPVLVDSKEADAALKKLGVKADKVVEGQRDDLVAAFNKIKTSGTASAREIEQAQRNLNRRLEAIDKQIGVQRWSWSRLADAGKKAAATVSTAWGKVTGVIGSIGRIGRNAFIGATAAVGGLVYGAGRAVKTFGDFQQGLLEVAKTTDFTADEMAKFRAGIETMLTGKGALPISSEDLLAIAAAAGQLGVKGVDNILKFSKVVAKLKLASNLSAEDAATELARILVVTGESIETVDVLATQISALGNSSEIDEAGLVKVSGEVARATARFKIGSKAALAIGTTLGAMGVQAENAGTSVGKVFGTLEDAAFNGGEKLAILSGMLKMSGDEIKRQFGSDAFSLFYKFLESLGQVQKSGGNISGILDSLGLGDERIAKTIPVLAMRIDKLGESWKLAGEQEDATKNLREMNAEIEEMNSQRSQISGARGNTSGIDAQIKAAEKEAKQGSTSLEKEFDRAAKGINARFQVISNAVSLSFMSIGEAMAPVFLLAAKTFADVAKSLTTTYAPQIKAFAVVMAQAILDIRAGLFEKTGGGWLADTVRQLKQVGSDLATIFSGGSENTVVNKWLLTIRDLVTAIGRMVPSLEVISQWLASSMLDKVASVFAPLGQSAGEFIRDGAINNPIAKIIRSSGLRKSRDSDYVPNSPALRPGLWRSYAPVADQTRMIDPNWSFDQGGGDKITIQMVSGEIVDLIGPAGAVETLRQKIRYSDQAKIIDTPTWNK